jgi:hypothetical protein
MGWQDLETGGYVLDQHSRQENHVKVSQLKFEKHNSQVQAQIVTAVSNCWFRVSNRILSPKMDEVMEE